LSISAQTEPIKIIYAVNSVVYRNSLLLHRVFVPTEREMGPVLSRLPVPFIQNHHETHGSLDADREENSQLQAYRAKAAEGRARDSASLLALCARVVAAQLDTLPPAEVAALPDDLLQVILDQAIALGTLSGDTAAVFAAARNVYRLELPPEFPLQSDSLLGAFFRCDLRDVSLPRARAVTDASLRLLAALPSLRALVLGGAPQVTDAGLRVLATAPHLTKLHLEGLPAPTGPGLAALLSALPVIRDLAVTRCPGVDAAALAPLSRLSTLRALTLSYNPSFPTFALPAGPVGARLERLELRGVRLADPSLTWLAALRHLTALTLNACDLTNAGVAALAHLAPVLEELDLGGNRALTGESLRVVGQLTRLRRLALDHAAGLGGERMCGGGGLSAVLDCICCRSSVYSNA
jgi:hypothetical protein